MQEESPPSYQWSPPRYRFTSTPLVIHLTILRQRIIDNSAKHVENMKLQIYAVVIVIIVYNLANYCYFLFLYFFRLFMFYVMASGRTIMASGRHEILLPEVSFM